MTGEYMPTTDEVRERYVYSDERFTGFISEGLKAEHEFDRWFKNGLDKAWLLGRSSGVVTAINQRSWELSPYRAESNDSP
jgi:hypothetical protein